MLPLLLLLLVDAGSAVSANKCFDDRYGLYPAIRSYIDGDCGNSFSNCEVSETYGSPMNSWCVGNVTDMSGFFWYKGGFNEDISDWDTSSVTSMAGMFSDATTFNGDLSNWNTSNVEDMEGMFWGDTTFNSDLNKWDTSNVESMGIMFGGATTFNGDLSNWDTSSVTNMREMFSCRMWTSFNGDLSNWDTSSVKIMEGMFYGATSFNGDLNKWETSSVEIMEGMFSGATTFNGDLSDWDTSNVSNMESMFIGATTFNGDLSNWDTSNVESMGGMFIDANSFNRDLCAWGDTFPYGTDWEIFKGSNCTFEDNPQLGQRGPFCASSCTKESGPTSRPSLSYTVRLFMSICKVVHCRWHCHITNFDSCHTFRTVNSDCILCGGNSYCYGPLSIELHYHLEAKSPKIMTR